LKRDKFSRRKSDRKKIPPIWNEPFAQFVNRLAAKRRPVRGKKGGTVLQSFAARWRRRLPPDANFSRENSIPALNMKGTKRGVSFIYGHFVPELFVPGQFVPGHDKNDLT
jgi:hypothetical protein